MNDDRRLLGRITPRATLAGRIGHTPVQIVDLSLRGSCVAHNEPLPIGASCVLTFLWDEHPIEATCEIVRSRLALTREGNAKFQTGLRIIEASNGSGPLIRQLICWHVTRALEEQLADARGLPPPPDLTSAPVEDIYIRCELLRGTWRRVMTHVSEQPALGFTVRASEPPAGIERLCATYLLSDRDMRRLIQKMAAASLESDLVVPARWFQP